MGEKQPEVWVIIDPNSTTKLPFSLLWFDKPLKAIKYLEELNKIYTVTSTKVAAYVYSVDIVEAKIKFEVHKLHHQD